MNLSYLGHFKARLFPSSFCGVADQNPCLRSSPVPLIVVSICLCRDPGDPSQMLHCSEVFDVIYPNVL